MHKELTSTTIGDQMPVDFDSEFAMTIDGELVFSEQKIPVMNPATEEVIAYAPDCGAAQLDAAVQGARHAFDEWRSTRIDGRRKLLGQLAGAIVDNLDRLARILTLEQGKALEVAKAELLLAVDWIRKTASPPSEPIPASQSGPARSWRPSNWRNSCSCNSSGRTSPTNRLSASAWLAH